MSPTSSLLFTAAVWQTRQRDAEQPPGRNGARRISDGTHDHGVAREPPFGLAAERSAGMI
jgi:hypothetical protein